MYLYLIFSQLLFKVRPAAVLSTSKCIQFLSGLKLHRDQQTDAAGSSPGPSCLSTGSHPPLYDHLTRSRCCHGSDLSESKAQRKLKGERNGTHNHIDKNKHYIAQEIASKNTMHSHNTILLLLLENATGLEPLYEWDITPLWHFLTKREYLLKSY